LLDIRGDAETEIDLLSIKRDSLEIEPDQMDELEIKPELDIDEAADLDEAELEDEAAAAG